MGSGRKALDPFDELTMFCVHALGRLLLLDPDVTRSRMKRELKRSEPTDIPHHILLDEVYAELRELTVPTAAERAAISEIEDPDERSKQSAELRERTIARRAKLMAQTGSSNPSANATKIDDIRHIIQTELGGRKLVSLPPLSSTEIGFAFSEVAQLASEQFGKKITVRQVKRRIALHYGPF